MFSKFPLKDSSFDNGIIAHEWGHFIQNRLVGNGSGLNTIQSRALGEGWSDVHSLIFLVKEAHRELAGNAEFQVPYATSTYVGNFETGIRRFPYTPDLTINPLMFEDINFGTKPDENSRETGGVHDAGEVWATALWDLYVNFLTTYDFQEAEKRFITYLVNGYKMTPISPTFTEARDAILAAIYATDKEDYRQALAVFARRGMGIDAVAPDRHSRRLSNAKNGFATELPSYSIRDTQFNSNYDGTERGFCSDDGILDQGETGAISAQIMNNGLTELSGVQVKFVVTSDHKVTFINGDTVTLPDFSPYQTVSTGEVLFTLDEAPIAENLTIEMQFPEAELDDKTVEPSHFTVQRKTNLAFAPLENQTNELSNDMQSITFYEDFKEKVLTGGEAANGTQSAVIRLAGYILETFGLQVEEARGEQYMWLKNHDFNSDVVFETKEIQVGYATDFELRFWHFYHFDHKFDGGVVEVSVNGDEWIDVTEIGAKFRYGYDNQLEKNQHRTPSSLAGRHAYTGFNINVTTLEVGNHETINFGAKLNGQRIKLRFRVASDSDFSYPGWLIDDVVISNAVNNAFSKIVSGEQTVCDNSKPKLTLLPTQPVLENETGEIQTQVTDRNKDDISYAWSQVAGPAATIEDATSPTLKFTPPKINKDVELTFELKVSDGKDEVSDTASVMITNIDEVVTIPKVNKDKGSALSWFTLLLLPILGFRRRM